MTVRRTGARPYTDITEERPVVLDFRYRVIPGYGSVLTSQIVDVAEQVSAAAFRTHYHDSSAQAAGFSAIVQDVRTLWYPQRFEDELMVTCISAEEARYVIRSLQAQLAGDNSWVVDDAFSTNAGSSQPASVPPRPVGQWYRPEWNYAGSVLDERALRTWCREHSVDLPGDNRAQ